MFSDRNNQWYLCFNCIFDSLAAVRRRNEDSSSIGLELFFCFP
jgi:hypothetical protein